MIGKKGQELSITTLILIVLAVVILALLVFGFTSGWSNLWDRINIFGGNNVNSIQNACIIACTSQDKYDFCSLNRTVKFGEKIAVEENSFDKISASCYQLSTGNPRITINLKNQQNVDVTEQVMANIIVEQCPNLCRQN